MKSKRMKYKFSILLKKGLLLLFLFFFAFIKTVDNENICGAIGGIEVHCFFSSTDNDPENDHVCVQCPSNNMVLWYSPIDINVILEISSIEIIDIATNELLMKSIRSALFRPPRNHLT
jgi:hypothetical protein